MSESSQTVLVVGASRGIGLALVEQLAATAGTRTLGTVRTASSELAGRLPNVTFLPLDISSEESVAAAAASVPELDILIVNAGMGSRDPVTTTSTEKLATYLDVNVLGPHRVLRAFLPALRKGKSKKIAFISSSSGSLEIQATPTSIGLAGCYGTSKTALNMLMVQASNELNRAGEGFAVISIHPGWVATDMGNAHGPGGMPPADSARQMLELIGKVDTSKSGAFYRFDGEKMPW
ncbi:hypothetical protein MKEN_00185100 [Mycena kentingensis (nom. inval.)]|nr:hypothetical protein MKEN_00185100 [Mycena kentingensis (nom. inval.)]